MALQHHPDKQTASGAEAEARAERHFKLLTEAYSALSDTTKRREYDNKRGASGLGRRPASGRAGGFDQRRGPGAARNPFARTDPDGFDGFGARDAGFGFGAGFGAAGRRRPGGAGGKWQG